MVSAGEEGRTLEERVRTLAQTAFDSVLFIDDARSYKWVNDRAAQLFGAPPEVILRLRMEDFTPPELVSRIGPFWVEFKRERTLEGLGPLRRHDGSQDTVEYRARWGFAPNLHLFVLRAADLAASQPGEGAEGRRSRLSNREREVLELAADGASTDDIAAALHLSPATVKTHFNHVYKKLGARDRVSAVATALRRGVIS
jgi:DNA-binding CsgD family transcriptional regulator